MILNNFYYYPVLGLLVVFMCVFFASFVLFIYKELGGVKVGRDSFLFFDYMLFCSGWKAEVPALSMLLVMILGNILDYSKDKNVEILYMNCIGILAVIFLFIHCRCLSGIRYYNDKKIKFLRELLWGFKMRPRFAVLWLSRLSYITFFALHFYKEGC